MLVWLFLSSVIYPLGHLLLQEQIVTDLMGILDR